MEFEILIDKKAKEYISLYSMDFDDGRSSIGDKFEDFEIFQPLGFGCFDIVIKVLSLINNFKIIYFFVLIVSCHYILKSVCNPFHFEKFPFLKFPLWKIPGFNGKRCRRKDHTRHWVPNGKQASFHRFHSIRRRENIKVVFLSKISILIILYPLSSTSFISPISNNSHIKNLPFIKINNN